MTPKYDSDLDSHLIPYIITQLPYTQMSISLIGEGHSRVEDSEYLTTWRNLYAELILLPGIKQQSFELVGCGLSYFKGKEYVSLFNTFKTRNNEYYLVKTNYIDQTIPSSQHNMSICNWKKARPGAEIHPAMKHSSSMTYKIIQYDLDTLSFTLDTYTDVMGVVSGNLHFRHRKQPYFIE